MKDRIPEKEWEWHGIAAHFCGSNDCLFHMGTTIGDVIISSVGKYQPTPGKTQEIGVDRFYETMVFKKGEICPCCGMPKIEGPDLEMLGANDAYGARSNHTIVCERAARREYDDLMDSDGERRTE